MTTALIRTVAAALALTFVVGAGAALATEPAPQGTIGARVAGYVVADEDPQAYVINTGSLSMTFEAAAPDGWGVSPSSLTLAPGEQGHFTLSGNGDAGKMVVVGYASNAPSGSDINRIEFGSIAVMQTRPLDAGLLIQRYGPLALLLVGLLFLLARGALWARRHVRIVHEPVPAAQPERWRPRRAPTPAGMHADRMPTRHPHDTHNESE